MVNKKVTVSRGVNSIREFFDLDQESILDFLEDLLVVFSRGKGDCETFGAESSRTSNLGKVRNKTYSVEVGVRAFGHVIVNDDIDSFDVNSSSEDVSSNHDSLFEVLEDLVSLNSNIVRLKNTSPPVSGLRELQLRGNCIH